MTLKADPASIAIILSVSGVISMLLYRLRLGRVALVVAFGVIVPHLLPLMKSQSFADEAISCIREYAVFMALIASALAMGLPCAIPGTRQTDDIANKEMNSLAPGARSRTGTPKSSVGDPLETKSDIGPLLFGYMDGAKLQPPDSASSEVSTLTLSLDSRHDPARIFEILGWVKTVGQGGHGQEDETTVPPQV
ncbi:hypothetical protein N0V84_009446 [Fusarium piperis]|uniref:Uncharacterized protein n=1 Tax=Fusarium piperis TaxID=1435070 RepID=A0A9W8W679_9HYPO|nr:hypothetical protein N0V84_009446 [Fusarium piperis]